MHRGDRGFEAIEQLCRDAIEASGAETQLTKPDQGAVSGGTAMELQIDAQPFSRGIVD